MTARVSTRYLCSDMPWRRIQRTASATVGPVITMTAIIAVMAITGTATRSLVAQQQWPQFRGLEAGEIPDDPSLPDRWSETENVAWSVDIPGLSWSSPVVWNDHIFVTTAVSDGDEPDPVKGLYDPGDDNGSRASGNVHRWVLYDIDFTSGRVLWQTELHRMPPPIARHLKNSFASETPVSDGRRVYVYLGTIGLVTAVNMSGETVWRHEIEAYDTTSGFGSAASPVVHGDRVYVVNDNVTDSFMIALDKNTGEELWRIQREERGQNWATPFIWKNEVRTELVTNATGGIRSYDLDGNLLWKIHGMSGLTIPTPFAKHGLLYLSSGYPGGGLRPVYAVRPGASGDISVWPPDRIRSGIASDFPGPRETSEYVAWSYPLLGTYNTSALVYGDYYYTLLDRGFLLCHDAKTGDEIYGRQRLEIGNGFTASPWAYNGKIFLLSEDGDTYVVKAGAKFEILHKNALNEMSLATPAIVRGSLILRTQSKLYRITQGG